MKQLPADVVEYERTETFDHETVPAEFLENVHSTRAGVWCCVRVTAGRLGYQILEPEHEEHQLDTSTPGIVEPGVRHRFELMGAVRFHVEFLKRPDGG